jgi:hypothetical protein
MSSDDIKHTISILKTLDSVNKDLTPEKTSRSVNESMLNEMPLDWLTPENIDNIRMALIGAGLLKVGAITGDTIKNAILNYFKNRKK